MDETSLARLVEQDTPPPLTPTPPLDVLRRIRRQSTHVVDIPPELVERWIAARDIAKRLAEEAERAQAAVIAALGDAEIGRLPDGREVTYFENVRRAYTVPESRFRVLRIRKGGS